LPKRIDLKRPILLKNPKPFVSNSESLIFLKSEEMRDDGTVGRRFGKTLHEYSLKDMVPGDRLLRKINRFLDFDDIRPHLKSF